MTRNNHQTTTRFVGSRLTVGRLRCEVALLQRDMDLYERLYSTWQSSRRQREARAEVRFHVIEAQLARLSAVGRMEVEPVRPSSSLVSPKAVVIPIAAYRA